MPTRHRVVRSQQELLDIAGEFLRAEDEQASPRVEYLPDIAMMDED
jgi:hypothetical protein